MARNGPKSPPVVLTTPMKCQKGCIPQMSSWILTDNGRDKQDPEILKVRKNKTADDHQGRACEEDLPPPNSISDHRKEDPQENITE